MKVLCRDIIFCAMMVLAFAGSMSAGEALEAVLEKYPVEQCFSMACDLSLDYTEREAARRVCILNGKAALPFLREMVDSEKMLIRQVVLEMLGEVGADTDEALIMGRLEDGNLIVEEKAFVSLVTFYRRRENVFIEQRIRGAASGNQGAVIGEKTQGRVLAALLIARGEGEGGLPEEVETLALSKLESENAEMRRAALACLKRGGEASRNKLRQVLGGGDGVDALLAADALLAQGAGDISDALRGMLNSKQSIVRTGALELMRDYPSPVFEEDLAGMLADESWKIRALVCEALAKTGVRAITPGLRELLEDKDARVWSRSVVALSRQGAMGMEWRLLNGLSDDRPLFRAEAARALAELEEGRAAEKIVKLLQDESAEVAVAAARALRKIPDPEGKARVALRGAMHDKRLSVALAAAETLDGVER